LVIGQNGTCATKAEAPDWPTLGLRYGGRDVYVVAIGQLTRLAEDQKPD
jgi:hypothetical protein